jgi:hypothetical protein
LQISGGNFTAGTRGDLSICAALCSRTLHTVQWAKSAELAAHNDELKEHHVTDRQKAFFTVLCRAFPANAIRTKDMGRGGTFQYVDARTIQNRLDGACGPHGWYPEYRETQRGYTCRLHILIPDDKDGWEWRYKEDGGGFAGMTEKRKIDGQYEEVTDISSDEKSAYSDSFKRAACVWGIGRYLYPNGTPPYLIKEGEEDHPPRPENRAAASTTNRSQGGGQVDARNFERIPPTGKAVWAWVRAMEQYFQTRILSGMVDEAKKNGWSERTDEWNQTQVNTICKKVIEYLSGLEHYQGEFATLLNRLGGSKNTLKSECMAMAKKIAYGRTPPNIRPRDESEIDTNDAIMVMDEIASNMGLEELDLEAAEVEFLEKLKAELINEIDLLQAVIG